MTFKALSWLIGPAIWLIVTGYRTGAEKTKSRSVERFFYIYLIPQIRIVATNPHHRDKSPVQMALCHHF